MITYKCDLCKKHLTDTDGRHRLDYSRYVYDEEGDRMFGGEYAKSEHIDICNECFGIIRDYLNL